MNAPETSTTSESDSAETNPTVPKPLTTIQRRILGVLIEKARTTPDNYPLSLNALVTGCNQKSNRAPLMSLSAEQVEDALDTMRNAGIVAEVHGGGRVPKYRHFGHDYMGVKGVEAGVMTELLLRGEQTLGDLRSRASRFGSIPDQKALQEILSTLEAQQLIVPLTPPGRGQIYTHNLYEPHEMEELKALAQSGKLGGTAVSSSTPANPAPSSGELEQLREEVAELRKLLTELDQRVKHLES